MAVGGKFNYDKYVKGPEVYQIIFMLTQYRGSFYLMAKINKFLKNILWQNKL